MVPGPFAPGVIAPMGSDLSGGEVPVLSTVVGRVVGDVVVPISVLELISDKLMIPVTPTPLSPLKNGIIRPLLVTSTNDFNNRSVVL